MSILTTKSYIPCDVIHTEKPFVRVLRHDLWNKVCAGCCDIDKKDLKKCTACKVMKYCGKSCQKEAWKDHKLECPYLQNYTNLTCQDMVQMVGNVILKLKERDWKTVTSRILDSEVSFADLLSNSDHIIETLEVDLRHHIEIPLESYIGKENMPDRATLKEIFGKVSTNQFAFGCGDPHKYIQRLNSEHNNVSEGYALFLGLSKLDHSCIPNAIYDITGCSGKVRAIRPINKSEKVTIGYTCMMGQYLTPSNNYEFLKQVFREKCYCCDCSQPFGESKLTKILDMSKATKVLEETERTLERIRTFSSTSEFIPNMTKLEDVLSRGELQNLLDKQENVLGKTNLRRMQVLEVLHFLDAPKEENLAVLVELTKSMQEVWGEYYHELLKLYKEIMFLHLELDNEKEAKAYRFKVWSLESVMYGKFQCGMEWKDTLQEIQLRVFNDLVDL